MITERLMGVGAWSFRLDSATPGQILDRLLLRNAGRGHVVITPTWANLAAMSDADALALSVYTGIYLKRVEETLTLSGRGVNGWLGDGNRGRSTGGSPATRTFPGWATFLTPDFLGEGIRSSIAGNFTHAPGPVLFNEVANAVADRFDAAWRVTNDFMLDFGTYAALFRSTPVAVAMRYTADSGRDLNVRGITGDLSMTRDIEDWARTVVYWWDDDGTPTPILQTGGVSDVNVPFRNPDGTPAWVDVIVNDSQPDNSTDATALSLAQWGRFAGVRNEFSLSSTEYRIGRDITVGDNLWVFDMERGVYDLANPVVYRGQTIFPQVMRCVGYTWPVREGMGVWFRRHRKVDSTWVLEWTDLTEYIKPESGDTTVDVGAKPRSRL